MGNLYTQLKITHDPRIQILFDLKCAYRTTPRNYILIQKELRNIDVRPKKNIRKKLTGIFSSILPQDTATDVSS